jgi:hypothetical protein
MSDEQKPGVLSYPNRPNLKTTTIEEVAEQSAEKGPQLDYPARQQDYRKPAVYRTDGVQIAPGTKTDVLARQGHLASADLSGLKVDGYLVAEGRNLARARLTDARLHNARLRDWNLQGADCSGLKAEGCDVRGWDLTGALLQGVRFVRCQVDGIKAPGLKASALQECTGIPAEIGDE